MEIVGLDLAGSPNRMTGFCSFNGDSIKTKILHTDDEIISETLKLKPQVIAIDAPLFLPKGRKSIEERNNVHLRECDKELVKLGIKFFPITLGPMRKLTTRGISLKKIFGNSGMEAIETYPGAAQDILGIPRKQKGLDKLSKGLENLGLRFDSNLTHDELDAVTCAYVGKLYLQNNYLALGDKKEGLMVLPLHP
ncbi:DUF429 domain-containing protein [Candidatus Micrarchaeota archaeon]|nr:DUF429 domain-containing protein [Candidatus Micrarchaeota archaeon]